MRGDYRREEDQSRGYFGWYMTTRDDCIEGAWFCIVYVIGALDIREDLEHRLVGVTDEGSYCVLLRPEGL